MELKIMEWDHPLSYFQRSASLWSSFESRKFSIGLQKQNNYLFSQAPFYTCFCNGNSNPCHQPPLIALCLRSYHFPPCWDLLVLLCFIILTGKRAVPISKCFPLLPLPAQAPSTETCLTTLLTLTSHKGGTCSFSLPSHFPGLDFVPMHSSFSPCFFWSNPCFASFTSTRLSEPFLQTWLKGFHSSIPPAAPIISCAWCL